MLVKKGLAGARRGGMTVLPSKGRFAEPQALFHPYPGLSFSKAQPRAREVDTPGTRGIKEHERRREG